MCSKSLRYLCFQNYRKFELCDSVSIIPVDAKEVHDYLEYYLEIFGTKRKGHVYKIDGFEVQLNVRKADEDGRQFVCDLYGYEVESRRTGLTWSVIPSVDNSKGTILHASKSVFSDDYSMIIYSGSIENVKLFSIKLLGFYLKSSLEHFDKDVLGVGAVTRRVYHKIT